MKHRRAPVRKPLRLQRLWRRELRWYEAPLLRIGAALAAVVYACVLAFRSVYWRRMRRRANVMTVSVGNLTVGGSGKTPFTIFLAGKLCAERGLSIGIVSRGYGGRIARGKAAMVFDGNQVLLDPEQAGDEPLMMAKRFDGPIAVARRRIDGIELLERDAHVDAVLLDDAFQHIRLARDFDLLLVNTDRGFGNNRLLPAGPMRERLSAARRADAIVLIGSQSATPDARTLARIAKLGHSNIFRATIRPQCLIHVEFGRWREVPIAIVGRRVLAVSGVADANSFYEMIRAQDAELIGVLEYPDHHLYTAADWQTITHAARDAEMVITTEKDLVKLDRFPFPRDSLYALRLEVSMDEKECARLLDMIVGAGHKPRQAASA